MNFDYVFIEKYLPMSVCTLVGKKKGEKSGIKLPEQIQYVLQKPDLESIWKFRKKQ